MFSPLPHGRASLSPVAPMSEMVSTSVLLTLCEACWPSIAARSPVVVATSPLRHSAAAPSRCSEAERVQKLWLRLHLLQVVVAWAILMCFVLCAGVLAIGPS